MVNPRRKWWLCVAPAVVCAVDSALTLAFQPAAYWAGEYDQVRELSPPDHWMLARHPLLFVAWVGVWIAASSVAIRLLPTRASLVLAVALVLGNASGASSWVGPQVPARSLVELGMFLAAAVLVVATWAWAGVLVTSDGQAEPLYGLLSQHTDPDC